MPELAEFLAQFRPHFRQLRSFDTFCCYLTGLLSDHPNKNSDTIASIIPGTNEQQLNHLTTAMVCDHLDLNTQRVEAMFALQTEGHGCLIFDDTGFGKQGQNSVGVARQYSGTPGKVANCQVTVNCHYAERNFAFPVATRLYLPQQWCDDTERMKRAGMPPDTTFKTKAEIALSLLDYANSCGVGHSSVRADADYWDNPTFLNGLEERRERYVVAVRANFSVSMSRKGEVKRADELVEEMPLSQWRTISWREGSKAWLRAKFVAVRCFRVDGDSTRHKGWLIGQRAGRAQSGERKYFWSNFEAQTGLEVRVRGRKRQAFSPSAGSKASAFARSASAGSRMAEGRSNSGVDRHWSHQSFSPNAKLTK